MAEDNPDRIKPGLELHRTFESWARECFEVAKEAAYLNGELKVARADPTPAVEGVPVAPRRLCKKRASVGKDLDSQGRGEISTDYRRDFTALLPVLHRKNTLMSEIAQSTPDADPVNQARATVQALIEEAVAAIQGMGQDIEDYRNRTPLYDETCDAAF